MNTTAVVPQTRRILLVEDEPGIQEAMAMLLELEGYRVTCADDGEQGLAYLDAARPHLIIADYMMPRLDGLEMARRIRGQPAHADTPILLMSAALPPGTELPGWIDRFLRKPTPIEQVLAVVAELLD